MNNGTNKNNVMTKNEAVDLKSYFSDMTDINNRRIEDRFSSIEKLISKGSDEQKAAVKSALDAQEKAVNAALCVSIDTPILCADLSWRPAGELKEGDELIAVEEISVSSAGRCFKKSIVIANSQSEDDLLLVTTPQGSVRCNPEHPWLVWFKHESKFDWKKTKDLKVGDRVSNPVDVWKFDKSWENQSIRRKGYRGAVITSIETAGKGLVANLTTSTSTYIANGFVMHNTAAKEAVTKAEIAADKRFEDFNGNIENLRKEVAGLRESRSSGTGKDEGSRDSRISVTNAILTLIALASLLVAFLKG